MEAENWQLGVLGKIVFSVLSISSQASGSARWL